MKTPEELEKEALGIAGTLAAMGADEDAEIIRELTVRYRVALIRANNFEKALEGLDRAKVH